MTFKVSVPPPESMEFNPAYCSAVSVSFRSRCPRPDPRRWRVSPRTGCSFPHSGQGYAVGTLAAVEAVAGADIANAQIDHIVSRTRDDGVGTRERNERIARVVLKFCNATPNKTRKGSGAGIGGIVTGSTGESGHPSGVHYQDVGGINCRTRHICIIALRILNSRTIQIECGDCQVGAALPGLDRVGKQQLICARTAAQGCGSAAVKREAWRAARNDHVFAEG